MKFERPTPAFTAIDQKLFFIQLIYCAVNMIACAYYYFVLNALLITELSVPFEIILFVSILLGPPVTLLIVMAINITCYYCGGVLPNAATSCLVIGISLLIGLIDLFAHPQLFAGV